VKTVACAQGVNEMAEPIEARIERPGLILALENGRSWARLSSRCRCASKAPLLRGLSR